jgi:hypothetical protein
MFWTVLRQQEHSHLPDEDAHRPAEPSYFATRPYHRKAHPIITLGPAVLLHERRRAPPDLLGDLEPLHAAEQADDFAALRRSHPAGDLGQAHDAEALIAARSAARSAPGCPPIARSINSRISSARETPGAVFVCFGRLRTVLF